MLSLLQPLSLVLLTTAMVTLQTLSAHYFPQVTVLIDLPLVALLYITLIRKSLLWILFLGTLVGVLQDSQTVSLFGLNGFSNIAVCSLVYLSSAVIAVDRFVARLVIFWLSFLLSNLISWMLRIFFLNRYESFPFDQALVGAFICTLIGLPLFYLFDRVLRMDKD